MKSTMDQTGRIELPGFIQSQLGLEPGDEVHFEQRQDDWVIRPVAKAVDKRETEPDDDDLNWPDLEYQSLLPRRVGEVTVRYEHRGQLRPMLMDLDELP